MCNVSISIKKQTKNPDPWRIWGPTKNVFTKFAPFHRLCFKRFRRKGMLERIRRGLPPLQVGTAAHLVGQGWGGGGRRQRQLKRWTERAVSESLEHNQEDLVGNCWDINRIRGIRSEDYNVDKNKQHFQRGYIYIILLNMLCYRHKELFTKTWSIFILLTTKDHRHKQKKIFLMT